MKKILAAIAEVRAGGAPMTSEIARMVVRSFMELPSTKPNDTKQLAECNAPFLSGHKYALARFFTLHILLFRNKTDSNAPKNSFGHFLCGRIYSNL